MLEFALAGAGVAAVVKARRAHAARDGPRRRRGRAWELPPLHTLGSAPRALGSDLGGYADRLVTGLSSRGVSVALVDIVAGPSVVRFELALGLSERVSRLTALKADIGYILGAPNPRILTTVDGRSVMGIEIPRPNRQLVTLGSVLASERLRLLDIAIGLTADGAPMVANVTELPHVVIAGATGAGKSTFLNSLIVSLLMGASPRDLQLLLIDPKRVELAQYQGLPHLWRPVVTEGGEAIGSLLEVVDEMDKRYKFLASKGFRNISEARASGLETPYLIVIIDEVADLMMQAKAYVEPALLRIAQLGRAAGVHLVVATQRPSIKVLTGDLKANIPSKVAFAVSSNTDSRVILDAIGAENLTGKGDLLYSDGGPTLTRAQGALVTDSEIGKVVQWWKRQK